MDKTNNFNKIESIKNKAKIVFKVKSISQKKRISKFRKDFKHFVLMNWTWPKKVFLAILIIVLVGAILLYLPISYQLDSYTYVNHQYIFNFVDNFNEGVIGGATTGNEDVTFNFADALFYSVSAFTTTGLSGRVDVGTQMSIFGQVVIYILFQIGGFGYGSLFYLFGRFLQRITKKSFFSTSLSHIERGGTKISDSPKMIVRIFFVILSIQLFFGIILFFILFFTPFKVQQNPDNLVGITIDSNQIYSCYNNFGKSLWKAMFLSGSAINNAGFDLFGRTSLAIFRNDIGVIVQVIVIILFLIGGIGYPAIYDLLTRINWIWRHKFLYKVCKVQKYKYLQREKFSSFTKICLISSFVIIVISLALVYISEYTSIFINSKDALNNIKENYANGVDQIIPMWTFWDKDFINMQILAEDGNKYYFFGNNREFNFHFSLIFNTLSTRSAGFSTWSASNMSETTRWIFVFLMFIGASPSSTGGGIRTTTIVVIFQSIISWLKGNSSNIKIFNRNIPTKDVISAFLIFVFGFFITLILSSILYLISMIKIDSENNIFTLLEKDGIQIGIIDFMFEAFSAFGTCGLSTGISTSIYATWWMRLPVIVLMFLGQLGVGSALEVFAKKSKYHKKSKYLDQSIRLG